MVKAWRKPVITVNGTDYGIGDRVTFLDTTGAMIHGIIKDIKFAIGPGATIELYTNYGSLEIDTDTILDV